jgi:hypothetical protein
VKKLAQAVPADVIQQVMSQLSSEQATKITETIRGQ